MNLLKIFNLLYLFPNKNKAKQNINPISTQKVFTFVLFLFFCSFHLSGQSTIPAWKMQVPYKMVEGKKMGYYLRSAKKLKKRGDLLNGSSCALKIMANGNKRQKKKAKKYLDENFATMRTNSLAKIEQLEKEVVTFENEMTSQKANQLFCLYSNLSLAKQLNKAAGTSYELDDYTSQKEEADVRMQDYFKKTAEMYYQDALANVANAQHRADYLKLARMLKRAIRYDNREDILLKYGEILPLATTRFGVAIVQDQTGHSGVSSTLIREDLGKKFDQKTNSKNKNSYPLFDFIPNSQSLVPNSTNVEIEIVIIDVNHITSRDEPRTTNESKEIGSDDKKVKVNAKYTTYTKSARSTVEATFTITDKETNQVLRTNTISASDDWSYEWATYTGDKRALSKYEKRMTERKEEQYINEPELVTTACFTLANNIAAEIKKLMAEIGR